MSQTWKINNLELEFDIFDLENSEKYEKAFEQMSAEEKAIYELAKQNAKNTMEAIIQPFMEQLDEEYQLQIE